MKKLLACLIFVVLCLTQIFGQLKKKITSIQAPVNTPKSYDGYLYTIDQKVPKIIKPLFTQNFYTTLSLLPWPDSNQINLRLILQKCKEIDSLTPLILKDVESLEIDVLGQIHNRPEMPKDDYSFLQQRAETRQSQKRIKDVLLVNNYEAVTFEGIDNDKRITKESLLNYFYSRPQLSALKDTFSGYIIPHVSMVSFSHEENIRSNALYDLISSDSLYPNFKSHVIGGEDSLMNEVGAILSLESPDKAIEEMQFVVFKNCARLRSQIALLKIVSYLKKNNLKKGAIVIGDLHREDLDALAKSYGIKINFYSFLQND